MTALHDTGEGRRGRGMRQGMARRTGSAWARFGVGAKLRAFPAWRRGVPGLAKVVNESWPQDCNGDEWKHQLHTCDGEEWVTEVASHGFLAEERETQGKGLNGRNE